MSGVLLDTDVLVDNLRGQRRLIVSDEPTSYSVVTLCELFSAERVDEEIVLATLSPFTPIGIDAVVAEEAGRIRRGSGIEMPDALIAATALVYDLELITRNRRDFGRVVGLRLGVPLATPPR